MRSRFRVILVRFGLVLLSLLVALLIAEGGVRILAPQAVAVPWQDEVNGITAPRANVQGRHAIPRTFDVTITFNSQRFRGNKDLSIEPGPGILRIAALGDSFTLGYGANDQETYPAQLEQILRERLKAKIHYQEAEVINAGNGGTGTGEQALWYETWVKKFHPHVVVLAVVSNDVDDDLARNLFSFDKDRNASPRPLQQLKAADQRLQTIRQLANDLPGYRFLTQHSQLVGLLRNTASRIVASSRNVAAPQTAVASESKSGDLPKQFTDKGLSALAAEIVWLNNRTHESGTKLTIVFIPSRESVYSSRSPFAHDIRQKSEAISATLTGMCLKAGIPFTDLTPQLRQQAAKLPRQIYYDGLDTHPNSEGYRSIAEMIAGFLVQSGVI